MFGTAERCLYRTLGVADPAHYLHYRYLRRALDSHPEFAPRSILDAGCGRGDYSIYLARRYPQAQVLGIDIDEERVRRCQDIAGRLGLTNLRFEVGDVTRIDEVDTYDLVVSIDVLEHIPDQPAALSALARALRPGGVCFYHIPTLREKPVPMSARLDGFHAWAAEEHVAEDHTHLSFAIAVHASGLEVVDHCRTFGYCTGELATSLFALPYSNTLVNRALQGLLAPVCRLLSMADLLQMDRTRYAVALVGAKVPVEPAHRARRSGRTAGALT